MYPRPDPWVEQARREAAHRAVRRQKRRRWLVPVLVLVVVLALGAGVAVVLLIDRDRADQVVEPLPVTIPVETTIASAPPIAPADLVAVDEVWLVDRGDGTFDWGIAVRTQPGAPSRSGVEVTVRLISAGDGVVESAGGCIGSGEGIEHGGIIRVASSGFEQSDRLIGIANSRVCAGGERPCEIVCSLRLT